MLDVLKRKKKKRMKINTRFSIILKSIHTLFKYSALFIAILFASNNSLFAQETPIFPNNQVLVSGTLNQPGSVYRFSDVSLTVNGGILDVDALVTLVSFTGTPTVNTVDGTTAIVNRFEPSITYDTADEAVTWNMQFIVADSSEPNLADAIPIPLDSYSMEIIDMDDPDLQKYPALAKARGFECTLEHGDALYIPSHWWHWVKYETPSLSLTLRSLPTKASDLGKVISNLLFMRNYDNLMRKLKGQKWIDYKNRKAIERTNRYAGIN